MKKLYLFIFTVFVSASALEAQSVRYTVRFKDKKASQFSISQPSAFLSAKSIQRRIRQNIKIDSTDLPVNASYVDSIANIPGVTILTFSKWLNQVIIETSDASALEKINSFPFILHSSPAGIASSRRARKNSSKAKDIAMSTPQKSGVLSLNTLYEEDKVSEDTINYGNNYAQVHIHEGEYLHKLGFRGQGMTIAMLDAGYLNYKTNPAFDSVRLNNQVLGEYDFVMNETSVNEDNVHGANCFSILAANRPGIIVGTAPRANYWLFRTEDAASERPIEELNWIAAAERADSAGADMISSSLGYTTFDDPAYNHSYAQRDGNTAMITIAADLAVKKGMIVMNSAGNSGNSAGDAKYIMCPADGDSVVSVGAVNSSGVIGGFSSWGPNSAGRIKPNIVSLGWGAVYANSLGNTATGNGTSYSNPNIAGLIACLWQAFPEFTNVEIIDAVQKSADRYNNPDNRYGYGIPNFRVAFTLLETIRQDRTNAILNGKWITVFPVPFKQIFTVFVKAPSSGSAYIKLYDFTGRIIEEKTIQVVQGSFYTVRMNPMSTKRYGVYFLQYYDGKNRSTVKLLSL